MTTSPDTRRPQAYAQPISNVTAAQAPGVSLISKALKITGQLESTEDITFLDFEGGANPLDALLGPAGYSGYVLLGLSKSSYIDSTGVGWLIQSSARFEKAGGRLVMHSITPMINHCFRVLGMYDVLHIVDCEATALKLIADVAAPTTVV